jgi:hypothetical protein
MIFASRGNKGLPGGTVVSKGNKRLSGEKQFTVGSLEFSGKRAGEEGREKTQKWCRPTMTGTG